MIKFSHLLILSALLVWLIGSGCVDTEVSEVEESIQYPNNSGTKAPVLNEIEVLELEADMAELEALLENMSLEEEFLLEDI